MAPTVVLLHAFPLDRRVWDGVVDAIAEADWDVVVPDLRGFGESAYGDGGPDDEPSLSWMARDVLGILDRMGVNSAVIVGLSLGGYVAMEILRQDPTRVAGLVLADTKASADTDEARNNRLRVADQVLAVGSTVALARAVVRNLLGTTSQRERPDIVAEVTARIAGADPAGVAWAQRAMAARPDSHAVLAAMTSPALVLWGAEDTITPRPDQDSMLAVLRDARAVEIERAGHLTPVENPTATATAILEFLDAVRRLPQGT